MVNSGAIAATSLVPGGEARGASGGSSTTVSRVSRAASSTLDDEVYASASATNHRNQAIARLLQERGRIDGDPREALDLYTRQCSLRVTATDIAVMGATLADGGVNPVTGERVVERVTCRNTLAVMTTPGLYETSGRLALRRRPAGQERDRRRHRDGLARARAGSGRSRRGSTPRATASRGSSSRAISPAASAWISSSRSRCSRAGHLGFTPTYRARTSSVNLHTDLPTRTQIDRLLESRHPASVSIYLSTEPDLER